ncbi:hypothetical protein [Candidatus Uabimicrobium sp. HlEnr_7]|uniref:hypothetical protein n=1 Tax=Candidatus Uabimicrobium helgolandensis TaxID=3095367 RepID=UPI0035567BFA
MKIVVKCSCGKILRLPMEYAGRHAKCPQCSKLNVVPKLSEEENASQIEVRSCPTCGSYLSEVDEICISCCTNLKTGEWDASKIKRKNLFQKHWQGTTFTVLLITIAFLAIRLWQKDQQISSFLEKENNISNLDKKALSDKWQRLQNFQKGIHLPQLLNYRASLWKELHQDASKKQTVLQKWIVALQLNDQKFLHKKEKELLGHFHLYQTKVEQLLHEQRYREVVTRVTPTLLDEIFTVLLLHNSSDSLKKSVTKLVEQYKGATHNAAAHNASKNDITKEKKQFRSYQKKFKHYLRKFYITMHERQYVKAQAELEKFWNDINALSYFEPENKFVQEIRQKLKDVQAIQRLIDTAQKGAKYSKGLKRNLSLRNHKKIIGRIEKYNENTFYIVNGNKEHYVHLVNLSDKDIIFFALREDKNDDTFLNAAIFLGYEKNYHMAVRMLKRAQSEGASFQEIKVYYDWLQEMSKETK